MKALRRKHDKEPVRRIAMKRGMEYYQKSIQNNKAEKLLQTWKH